MTVATADPMADREIDAVASVKDPFVKLQRGLWLICLKFDLLIGLLLGLWAWLLWGAK